jgi:hypothetical protein
MSIFTKLLKREKKQPETKAANTEKLAEILSQGPEEVVKFACFILKEVYDLTTGTKGKMEPITFTAENDDEYTITVTKKSITRKKKSKGGKN